jgi:hypothetical protein
MSDLVKSVRCPNCKALVFDEPQGMCCNAGAESGYQYQCPHCNIWFIDTFDGRQIIDFFLTVALNANQETKGENP